VYCFGRLSSSVIVLYFVLLLLAQIGDLSARNISAQVRSSAPQTINTLEERQQALNQLQLDLSSFRANGDLAAAARTLNAIGLLRLKLNTPQLALDSFNEALSIIKTHPAIEVEVDSLNGSAAAYLVVKGTGMDQVNQLQHSLSLAETAGYVNGKARALLTLSEYQNFEDHNLALETAQASLRIWETLGDKDGRAAATILIGRYLMAQNRLAEATEKYTVALNLLREQSNRAEEAEALIMLGFIEFRKAEWQKSIDYLTEARGLIDERAEPRMMGQISGGLAEAFTESGMPEEGLAHLQRTLGYYEQTGDPRKVRMTKVRIGYAQLKLGNYEAASNTFEEVLRQIEPDTLDATEVYGYLGRIALATAQYPKALSLFERSLPTLINAHNPLEAAQVDGLIGQVYEQQGNLGAARRKYLDALSTFERVTARGDQAIMYHVLGRLELKEGQLLQAEDYLKRSMQITESIRSGPASTDLSTAFSATVHDRYQTYIDCLMRLHSEKPEQGFAVRAFETSELARARSLVELLRTTQIKPVEGMDEKLAEQERSLNQAIRAKEDSRIALLAGTSYKKADLEVLNSELAKLEEEYKNVVTVIQTRYPTYEPIVRSAVWPLKQIQEQVIADDQTLLLEYALGEERSYLWIVGRSEFSAYELPARAQIEDSIDKFHKLLTANEPVGDETFEEREARVAVANQQIEQVSASLADLIVGPALNKLGNKRLLIVPDGKLQTIPFQALMVPPHDANSAATWTVSQTHNTPRVPLIVDHEIVNEPSAVALGLVRSEKGTRVPPSKSVAIFANPVFEADDPRVRSRNSSWTQVQASYAAVVRKAFRDAGAEKEDRIPALPASRDEADAIASVAPWRSVFKAVDFDASRATIMETDLGQFSVVHFATHGRVNYMHPESSGLFLSLVDQEGRPQKGFFGLRDIYNLRLPVGLVVLSACNTALGKQVKGEGLIGITRGFMHAGARGVAASLWKVEDDATAELMKRFYEGMFKKGLTPGAALREAQISMWQQKRWRAPYYWASFIIQGQYDQRVSTPAGYSPVVYGLIAALAGSLCVAAGYMYLRRRKRRL
jgi:CHAT domain-containing protein/uncharacterized protein HemY